MANTLTVAILSAYTELLEVEARCLLFEAAFSDNFIEEFSTGNELEDDEDLGSGGKDLLELHNMRVAHKLHNGDFFLDLGAHVLALDLFLVKHLNSDPFSILFGVGLLYLTEGTLAQGSVDGVLADLFGHFIFRCCSTVLLLITERQTDSPCSRRPDIALPLLLEDSFSIYCSRRLAVLYFQPRNSVG
mmetsp:Transcript_5373/g.11094  ORF Transcript_5373/g.11094 Transcript_5373/m.11094 type:complete len:188 (-) Transcript_5373:870-1433(-)